MATNADATRWTGTIKVGTERNDTMIGTNSPDLLLGLGVNDGLRGNGGDDLLCGGSGVDFLQGFAGNDLLNGGTGDHDLLFGGEGNDVLLDGSGVGNAQGGPGNDLFTLALRRGWRDPAGQPQFVGRLAAGYGDDTVVLVILDRIPFFIDITGDERDEPASPQEGNKDGLGLLGRLHPAPVTRKFEKQIVISATAQAGVDEEAGAEYLTEPVGDGVDLAAPARVFLPLVTR